MYVSQEKSLSDASIVAGDVRSNFDTALDKQNIVVRVKNAGGVTVREDTVSNNRMVFQAAGNVVLQRQHEHNLGENRFDLESFIPKDLQKQNIEDGGSYFSFNPKSPTDVEVALNPRAGTHIQYGFDPLREYYAVRADAIDPKDPAYHTGKISYVKPEDVPALVSK